MTWFGSETIILRVSGCRAWTVHTHSPAEATVCKATGEPARQLITESYNIPSDSQASTCMCATSAGQMCEPFRPTVCSSTCTARPIPLKLRSTCPARRVLLDGVYRLPRLGCLSGRPAGIWPIHTTAGDGSSAGGKQADRNHRGRSAGREQRRRTRARARRGVAQINLLGWSWGTSIMGTYAAAHSGKLKNWCSTLHYGCVRARLWSEAMVHSGPIAR